MRATTLFRRLAPLWGLALLLAGCVEAYMPDVISSPDSHLVIEGFINSQGPTTILLTRTYAIDAKTAAPVETKAVVYVEEESGPRYLLREGVKGTYVSDNLTLNTAKMYRLHLTTAAGQEYASEYVPVKTTPPIDALNWQASNEGVTVTVNSHDPTGASQYYRWEYDETWEFNTPYNPIIEYVNGKIRPIVVPYPSVCWTTVRGATIDISKTTALSQDVVSEFPVRRLPRTSNRFQRRYSILVMQHALTQQEYAYWELLRKNTENLGTLFDPQPAQLTGNVHCLSDESEITLGYVGAHSLTQKRIFIDRRELPGSWFITTGYEYCEPPDTVRFANLDGAFGRGLMLPIANAYTPLTGSFIGYLAAVPDCIDCRKRGTATKPSFW